MVFGIEDKDRIICTTCNLVVTHLVPMYDDDVKHERLMLCTNCKKAIKNGKPIKKFVRDDSIYKTDKK